MGLFQISQRFDLDTSGSFRKCPLLEHHHALRDACDHGRRPTTETKGGGEHWFY